MSQRTNTSMANLLGPPERTTFFRRALALLGASDIPFMVGGAYALERYTGIARRTKDIDLFVLPRDCARVLALFKREGYGTEVTDRNWIGKVFQPPHYLDVIFNSGNGICRVDRQWFAHAVQDEVLGIPSLLCPVEEIIWQKAFIMERERFDGADVLHLIRARGDMLDWARLMDRMGPNWEVLLSHLVLFRYVYPGERHTVPQWVMDELFGRAPPMTSENGHALCRGTLLSRYQYEVDLSQWHYRDARPEAARHPPEAPAPPEPRRRAS